MSATQVDAVALAVSEAVTNAVVHAYLGREPGGVDILVCPEEDYLTVVVTDDGSGMLPRLDSPGAGLGLALIAHHTETLTTTKPDRGGLRVSMTFAWA